MQNHWTSIISVLEKHSKWQFNRKKIDLGEILALIEEK